MIKKILITLNISIILFASFAILNTDKVSAAFNVRNFSDSSGLEDTGSKTGHLGEATSNYIFESTITRMIRISLSLVGIIFFALMFYSGYIWMTAKDDSKAVETAKNNIKTALIGLIIVLGAYAITNLVFGLIKPAV